MIQSLLLCFTTFLFIFGWKVTVLADLILITSLALVFFSFVRGYIVIERLSIRVLCLTGALSIYALVVVLLNGLIDTQIAMRSIRALINFTGAVSLVSIYWQRSPADFFQELLRDIYIALTAHAAIMVTMFVNTDFRLMIYHMTSAFDYVNLSSSILDGYRISGLTYGLSQTSVLQLVGLLLLPFLLRKSRSPAGALFYLCAVPLLVTSIFISGRSGIMIGMLFLPFIAPVAVFPTDRSVPLSTILSRTFATVVTLLVIFAGSVLFFRFLPPKFSTYSLGQAGEVFQALLLQGPTVNNMSGMLLMPDSWVELFFGSSNLGRGSLDNIPSDIGWVKMLFSLGITGSALMVWPYLTALATAVKFRLVDRSAALVVFMIFMAALVLNCKELALLTRNQWSVQALIFVAMAFELRPRENFEARN